MSAFTVSASIEGNLVDEPTLRRTANGLDVANMRVAVTSRTSDGNGGFRETTQFVPVVAWRNLGVNAAASLHKGTRIMVEGDLKQRTYKNKDGIDVYVSELHATSIGVSLRWHVVAGIEKASEALVPAEDDELAVA
jgi:single-strand DNA-binding protein